MQPRREYRRRKRKGMQINESKIAFIVFHLFFQKGTFQCVTADSNKKIAFLSSSRRRLCSTPPSNALHRLAPIGFTRPPTATVYHDIPFFPTKLLQFCWPRCRFKTLVGSLRSGLHYPVWRVAGFPRKPESSHGPRCGQSRIGRFLRRDRGMSARG